MPSRWQWLRKPPARRRLRSVRGFRQLCREFPKGTRFRRNRHPKFAGQTGPNLRPPLRRIPFFPVLPFCAQFPSSECGAPTLETLNPPPANYCRHLARTSAGPFLEPSRQPAEHHPRNGPQRTIELGHQSPAWLVTQAACFLQCASMQGYTKGRSMEMKPEQTVRHITCLL
jgi:hypothetical protein